MRESCKEQLSSRGRSQKRGFAGASVGGDGKPWHSCVSVAVNYVQRTELDHSEFPLTHRCDALSIVCSCATSQNPTPTKHWKQEAVLKATAVSSAQGNCSAKSLALVMSSILPCSSILPGPPCLPPDMLAMWGCPAAGGV